ncbi:3-isopropylmalate dehydratase small subunit [Blastomonas fulva]|uniref:3-isopropylmalate dehydratase small subunit n=1 Tax=Blastomonas fulva TaxID=1550728 RepID=UPI003F724F75
MSAFPPIRSAAVPMPQDNIDTDIIYPARFLLITDRNGLDRYGFYDWRFDGEGRPRTDFPMAREPWASAQILVTGDNFGCGSSREHAAWTLRAMGIRCIIAPGFGEIFYSNCFKNGILPMVVTAGHHAELLAKAQSGDFFDIDLAAGTLRCGDDVQFGFTIDAVRRDALLNGWDDIDLITATHTHAIDQFEATQRQSQPWLWRNDSITEETTHG